MIPIVRQLLRPGCGLDLLVGDLFVFHGSPFSVGDNETRTIAVKDVPRTVDNGPPISAVNSGGHCNASASLSDGVIQLRVCRGRVLSE